MREAVLAFGTVLILGVSACEQPSSPPSVGDSTAVTPVEPSAETLAHVAWVKANAIPIASTDPANLDFRDLEPLKAAIGDARVVMLGEESHLDGTTFLAKTRLIEFLHEEMGFDVLLWESPMYHVHEAARVAAAGGDALNAYRGSIFSIWTEAAEVQPMLRYATGTLATNRPLEFGGFDSQVAGPQNNKFASDIDSIARLLESNVRDSPFWPQAIGALSNASHGIPMIASQWAIPVPFLDSMRQQAATRTVGSEGPFWTHLLESTESEFFSNATGTSMWDPTRGSYARDEQMGRNLSWLAKTQFADKKIVVWAASFHTSRNTNGNRLPNGGMLEPGQYGWHMGDEAYKSLGGQIFSIAFIASEGEWGSPFTTGGSVPAPLAGSIEDAFARTEMETAFLNLRASAQGMDWLNTAIAGPFGYQAQRANWPQIFDGIVYTKKMVPTTRRTGD